eukprot:Awhi_evm1s10414
MDILSRDVPHLLLIHITAHTKNTSNISTTHFRSKPMSTIHEFKLRSCHRFI